MKWHKAFSTGNSKIAHRVAQYLRDYNWYVDIHNGRLEYTEVQDADGDDYSWSYDESESPQWNVNAFLNDMPVGIYMRNDLAALFQSSMSVGEYTKLPLPKDIPADATAPASHIP